MERVTITIDADLLAFVDTLSATKGYGSRSEAIRDILRKAARTERQADPEAPCFATLAYVYDHETRDLGRRLTRAQHAHHDLQVATLQGHLDHEACLEVAVLQGPVQTVRRLADDTVSQRGVRHGQLHVIPVKRVRRRHAHGGAAHDHDHLHA